MHVRRLLLFFLFIHCLPPLVRGQDYFQKVYKFHQPWSNSFEVTVLPDGKIAMLSGTVQPQDTTGQCNLLLLDARGDLVWSKLLVSGRSTGSATLALAPDGNLIVGLNSTDLAGAALTGVLKISAGSGNILWEFYCSLPSYIHNQLVYATNIARIVPLSDGGCAVLAVRTDAPSISQAGVSVLFKLDAGGNLAWEKTWADGQNLVAFNLAEGPDGDIYLAGRQGFPPLLRSALLKLSADGASLWNKTYDNVFIRDMTADADNNVWLAGIHSDPNASRFTWVQKTNGEGEILWSKYYTLGLPETLEFSAIGLMPNGDAVVSGHHRLVGESNSVLVRINPAGVMLWAKKYAASGANDYLVAVAPDPSGSIVAGGLTGENVENLDSWLLKTDPAGNIPDCCLANRSFSTNDVTPASALFDLQTTGGLETVPGSTISVVLPPDVIPFCTAGAALPSANAFTPNGDQVNDRFMPQFACPPERFRFTVYDRWGNKVFDTQELNTTGWDGRADGKDAVADTYAWFLEYDTFINGALEKKREKGDVTLLR